ncbi:MAG: prolipoprotein diacylglyceryl transferase [Pseudomonadota bacterium]
MAQDLPFFVNFDPVAISLGPLTIHWYGIAYLLAFIVFWALGSYRARQRGDWTPEEVSDLLFYGALGVVLGGRLGYIFFYDLAQVIDDPLRIFAIHKGGMSFHGGLIGVMVAVAWFGRKTHRGFFGVADFVVPLVPPGLFFGRIANFWGGELWGRQSDVPWAMIFPKAIDFERWSDPALEAAWAAGSLNGEARHPSQLYQAGLEGLALFAILWLYSRRPRPPMAVSGAFLLCYGLFRSFLEQFRQPDDHLEFIAFGWLTMGQALSLPMIIGGALLMALAYGRNSRGSTNP